MLIPASPLLPTCLPHTCLLRARPQPPRSCPLTCPSTQEWATWSLRIWEGNQLLLRESITVGPTSWSHLLFPVSYQAV